ncbi:MAG TPA: hypothetical protein VFB82_23155 [Blastocatellia bacterium]|nr:hypothetical protein [Blastocatellia bacterium]
MKDNKNAGDADDDSGPVAKAMSGKWNDNTPKSVAIMLTTLIQSAIGNHVFLP